MGMPWSGITAAMAMRRASDSALLQSMIDVRDRYNNELVIPLGANDDEPVMRTLMPQIIHDGIEGTAQRAAGMLPNIACPALDPGKERGRKSKDYADRRRRGLYSSWNHSNAQLLFRRAFRQLGGYGTYAMVVVPDFDNERAKMELRDPLSAYPELRSPEQMDPPDNVGWVYGRSAQWVVDRYPQAKDWLSAGVTTNNRYGVRPPEMLWDVVEWIDEDEIVVGILGPRFPEDVTDFRVHSGGIELKRWPNRAGMCPVAMPRRVTLDRIRGQMQQFIPMVDWMAKLMQLEVIAAERDVFPDIAVIGDGATPPELTSGEWRDGRSGDVNMLNNVRDVKVLHTPPGQQTMAVMQQLERAARMGSGTNPLYGGDNPNSLRTGRAIDSIGGFSVDPMVAEIQEILARSMERSINPSIIETEKGYWPDKKYVCFSGERGDQSMVEYVPSVHYETTENSVTYSFPGTDISQVTVALAQLAGASLISKRSARMEHPLIDNAEQEEAQLVVEQLRDVTFAGLNQQAQQGAVPVLRLAQMIQRVSAGTSIEQAIIEVDNLARTDQASSGPPGAPDGAVPPGSPQAQPGLAAGQPAAAGAQQPPQPPIGPPPQGLANFRQMLSAMRSSTGSI